MDNIGPRVLRDHLEALSDKRRAALFPRPTGSVIRKKDVLELFNTTADLTGSDLDVSPFIREADERNVQVFWRDWQSKDPNIPTPQPAPRRNELCSAPLNKDSEAWFRKKKIYRWDFLEGRWDTPDAIVPGQVYLLHCSAGGYDTELGWDPDAQDVEPMALDAQAQPGDSLNTDPLSHAKIWQTLAEHTNEVARELEGILDKLGALVPADEQAILRRAARWHDWGKAHKVFQDALLESGQPERRLPAGDAWAKSARQAARYKHPGFRHELDSGVAPDVAGGHQRQQRAGFRHELASALALLKQGEGDLACYLVAAHHGKVRLSIRSAPNETRPEDGRRFARGVWEGDTMEAVNLGGGVTAPAVLLSLACMESGLSAEGQASWAERMLNVLEQFGPFRLAYLETLLCAADRRASAKAGGVA